LNGRTRADFHALLTAEFVAVANRGRPFTREGLRAVCQAHLSPKSGNGSTLIKDETDAKEFLQEIRKQRLAAYKSCPSDLVEHAHAESVLRSEYAGRILPELLQNAHDAIAAESIGSKGVGFKAVLNVCEGPRIHSGPLHCGFDRQHSRQEFQDAGLAHDSENVPLMRLPFPIAEVDEPDLVRELIRDYDTVIVLPFINQSARARFLTEWQECAEEATLVLFLYGVDCVAWERCDGSGTSPRIWKREKRGSVVEVYDENSRDHIERWRVVTSMRTAVALRLGDGGAPVPDPNYPNIRVFFETDESSPLPVLLHADLPLKEGRTNVLIEDELSRTNIEELIQELADVVRDAFVSVSDAGLLLDLLCPRVEPAQMSKLEREVWGAVKSRLVDLDIPGADGLQLGGARLRPVDESHQASWWWWFDCGLWNAFKQMLSAHRVGQLSGLALLPPGVDTDAREKTILHLNPSARLSLGELRALPLLPVEGCAAPAAPSRSNIFLPHKAAPPSPPAGIDVAFTERRFVEAIEGHAERDHLCKVLVEILGVSEFKPISLIEKAILPILRKGDQPGGLIDFLCEVIAPALRDDELNFDWRDPVRRELAERLLIPLRNDKWLPAVQVYAGAEWTGNDFLEQVYANRNDRGFLHPPPENEKSRERWQRFYRYVGVGWCPKVLPVVCHEDKKETREGPRWDDRIFSFANPPERWVEYCGKLNDFEMGPKKARMRQNWTLDGGSDVLIRDGAFAVISDNWAYYSKYRPAVIYRSSNRKEDYDNEKRTGPSHLSWLFQTCHWVPVKATSEKQGPSDVFAKPDIARELGGWGYELDGSADEEFLKSIGVRSGWRELDDADWRRWLERSVENAEDEINRNPALRQAVYNLYYAALRHWTERNEYGSKPASWPGPVWCVERHGDNTETWRRSDGRDDIHFVDQPELDELRLPGVWVFPVRLNRLEEVAKKRFSLKLLSDHLQGKPHEAALVVAAADAIGQRLDERLPIMNAYLQVVGWDNPGLLERSSVPDVTVVADLKVRFRLDSSIVDTDVKLDAYHFRQDKGWMLWLDAALFGDAAKPAPSVWEYVANALICASDLPRDAQACLKDLLLYEGADLRRKLLNLGITKETVERIVPTEPVKPVTVKPGPEGGKHPPPEPKTPDAGTKAGNDRSSPAGGGGASGHGGSAGGAGSGRRPRPIAQPGREAQEWMRDELRRRLEPEGWRISPAPTHDEELRETDIEILHIQFGTFHVEVKHCETEAIYWSEKEVDKAKQNPGRYVMAVLTRGADEPFDEYWLKDPLDCLGDLSRSGIWEWRGREESVDLTDPIAIARWKVPTPKPMRPANFSFKVEIRREWLKKHGLKFEVLKAHFQTSSARDVGNLSHSG
jgi:hypothetical protein